MTSFIKLTDLPIYDPDPEASRRRVWDDCVKSGEGSYWAGLTKEQCPPFRDSDMTFSWWIGWHHAHDTDWKKNRARARKRCPRDCSHKQLRP